MVQINWKRLPEALTHYFTYQLRNKNTKPEKWFVILPLFGLWGIDNGRSADEMFGYVQYFNLVSRRIYLLSQIYGKPPCAIILCGGKTRSEVERLANLSEAETCREPFLEFLRQNGVDARNIHIVEGNSTEKNISLAFNTIERSTTFGYNRNEDHIVVFSDDCRVFKTIVLSEIHIHGNYTVYGEKRYDIHPNSNSFKQFFQHSTS